MKKTVGFFSFFAYLKQLLFTPKWGALYLRKIMHSIKSRRLRKKLYLDEFAILGFEFSCTLNAKTSDDFDSLLIQLVDFVESRGLSMGGGGDTKLFSAFISSDHRYVSATEEDRDAITAWLDNQEAINNITVGKLVDANYGI
jgi:uncharacterized protein YggL (DUF469 family)